MISRPATGLVVLVALAACSDPPARVTLVPVEHPCGRPDGVTAVRITAYAAGGEVTRAVGPNERVDITDFPADTEQLGVEVLVGGGVVGAIGKTAPLVFAALPDGAEIPIFMAPPGGFCPTVSPMTEARVAPVLARAGDRVLVIGGHDGAGTYLSSAELYDPATGTFTPVEVPDVLGESGFAGAAAATVPGGVVALSGGPQPVITLFGDRGGDAFRESVLIESRAFHTSIALDERRILVAGGCSESAAGACAGVTRRSTKIYDVTELGAVLAGPSLEVGRTGATIFDTGIDAGGERAYVIAGGSPNPSAPTAADRLTLERDRAVAITGTHAQAARLDGGGVLTAFALDGAPADGSASVIVPGHDVARPIAPARALSGVRLLGLEDGRVVGIGGSPEILVYDPTTERWHAELPPGQAPGQGTPVHAPALIGLPDGSVLVLGGHDGGGLPSRDAWIYRPSLIGPNAGSVTVVPGGSTSTVLTPVDPSTVTRTAGWELVASEDLARALVGGPRTVTGSVEATVRVRAGGVALIARHHGPGEELVGELAPGTPARLVQRTAGDARTACTGRPVPAFDAETGVNARLEVTPHRARLVLDGAELVACELGHRSGGHARGAWGLAALGPGARVAVDSVTVAR